MFSFVFKGVYGVRRHQTGNLLVPVHTLDSETHVRIIWFIAFGFSINVSQGTKHEKPELLYSLGYFFKTSIDSNV